MGETYLKRTAAEQASIGADVGVQGSRHDRSAESRVCVMDYLR